MERPLCLDPGTRQSDSGQIQCKMKMILVMAARVSYQLIMVLYEAWISQQMATSSSLALKISQSKFGNG